jgi:3'-5' exoribonuclease
MSSVLSEPLDLQAPVIGRTITGTVCLRQRETRVTSAGKPYLTLTLGNRSGAITATVWQEKMARWEQLHTGAPLLITGTVKTGHKGAAPGLEITRVEALPSSHPIALELNPVCPEPLERLKARYAALIASLSPGGLALLDTVLDHAGRRAYWHCPAAVAHHHAYIHGLAQHSLEVAELSVGIATHCAPVAEYINHDALVVGALLHDIGKLGEYEFDGKPLAVSLDGRTTYHTASGGTTVAVAAALAADRLAAAGVHPVQVLHLQHVCASHHLTREHGSVVEPLSPEGMIIHAADLVSARTRTMADARATGPVHSDGWVTPSGYKRAPTLWLGAALAGRTQSAPPSQSYGGASAGPSPVDAPVSTNEAGALPGRVVVRHRVRR